MMILENDAIKIECLNNHGGKLSSIYDKKQNFEVLFQNPHAEYKQASYNSDFSAFEACGFDDCFPTVDKDTFEFEGKTFTYPDHGEIWSSSMQVVASDSNSVTLSFTSNTLPYTYVKKYTLNDRGFTVSYTITNTGYYAFPCLYVFHCLVDCSSENQLILPKNSNKVFFVCKSSPNNACHEITSYPISETGVDLSKPNAVPKNEVEKFYVDGKVAEGKTGYLFPKRHTKVLITFDKDTLPYLGFWNTQGGFRGDYNIALEMSNAYYDNINIAQKNKACPVLKPAQTMQFSIAMNISDI